jgi:hypothetical protein
VSIAGQITVSQVRFAAEPAMTLAARPDRSVPAPAAPSAAPFMTPAVDATSASMWAGRGQSWWLPRVSFAARNAGSSPTGTVGDAWSITPRRPGHLLRVSPAAWVRVDHRGITPSSPTLSSATRPPRHADAYASRTPGPGHRHRAGNTPPDGDGVLRRGALQP